MQRKSVQLAAALLVLLLLIGAWLALRNPGSESSRDVATDSNATVGDRKPDPQTPIEPIETSLGAQRDVEAAPSVLPTDAFASLRVLATWSDSSSAAGVNIRVIREWLEDPAATDRLAQLDNAGSALFSGLAPGNYSVRVDRCGGTKVRVEAGHEAIAAIGIPDGVQVDGRVIDGAGMLVAGATILLSSNSEAFQAYAVGVSDGAGRFRLRDVEPGRMLVARIRDLTPSAPFVLGGEARERIECTLVLDGEGGNLDISIHDEKGEPVDGVEVLVGDTRQSLIPNVNGKRRLSDPPQMARSDAEGRCRLFGISAGNVLVQTRSRTYAPWMGNTKIEKGATTTLAITLGACGTIKGVITDSDSKPLSEVMLVAGISESFAIVGTKSREDGGYELDGLAPGKVDVTVNGFEAGREQRQIDVIAGQAVIWNVVLVNPRHLVGRVIDEDDEPLAHWRVDACPPTKVQARSADAVTDAEGRFRLDSIPPEATWLVLRDAQRFDGKPCLILREFPLPSDDFVIRVPRSSIPTAFVQGLVLGPQSRVLPKAVVAIMDQESNRASNEPVDAATGEFHLGPLMPGKYTLICSCDALGYGYHELQLSAGQELDVGVIELAPEGFVSVELHLVDGSIPLVNVPIRLAPMTDMGGDSFLCTKGKGKSRSLPRGEYHLQMAGDWYCEPQVVRVEPGTETHVAVTIEPGATRIFQLKFPTEAEISSPLRWELRDAGHTVIRSSRCDRDPSKGSAAHGLLAGLALGDYTLDVVSEEGPRGTLSFTISKPGFDGTALIVEVR